MNISSKLLLQKHFDTALESPDGIKKLRELILTLAMQGKLVKQDPKDQPASELLKEIQAEKERLVKEGKTCPSGRRVKKQKELPPNKPEDLPAGKAGVPYEVPEGWVWTRLGEISNVIAGNSFDSQEFTVNEGAKCIKITNVGVRNFIETDERLPFEFLESYKKFIVEEGDLIIALTRPFIKDGLKICVCPSSYHHSLLNQRVAAIKTYLRSSEFLYRYLCSEIVLSGYKKRFGNIGLQPNLKMEDVIFLPFPLPPLAEQKRIVAKIDELMKLCDKLEAQRSARKEKILAVHRAAINQLLNSSYNLRESAKSADNPLQFIFNNFDPLYSVKENVAELKKAILTLAMQGKLVKPACRQAGKTPSTLPKPEHGKYFVYVIECEDGSFYKGFTEDLPRRWKEHQNGHGADWTRQHKPKQVYYWEECASLESAIAREKYLKSGSGREWFKQEVVDNPSAWLPASELLKEIQAEKERLIKEGKTCPSGRRVKKQKELPPIKPEDLPAGKAGVPYQVPEGWVWVNIREVTHEWGQKTPDKDFIYIDVGSIDNSKGIIIDNPQVLAPEDAPSRARKIVKQGTVIYSTVRPYLLNIAIVERTYNEEPIASTAFAIMHPLDGLNGKFLYRYLNSQIFIAFVESKQKGVAYPAISDGDLFQGTIPLPPLAEQKRIVAKIDELMALCDNLVKQIDLATAKQTALFDAVLAGV